MSDLAVAEISIERFRLSDGTYGWQFHIFGPEGSDPENRDTLRVGTRATISECLTVVADFIGGQMASDPKGNTTQSRLLKDLEELHPMLERKLGEMTEVELQALRLSITAMLERAKRGFQEDGRL